MKDMKSGNGESGRVGVSLSDTLRAGACIGASNWKKAGAAEGHQEKRCPDCGSVMEYQGNSNYSPFDGWGCLGCPRIERSIHFLDELFAEMETDVIYGKPGACECSKLNIEHQAGKEREGTVQLCSCGLEYFVEVEA